MGHKDLVSGAVQDRASAELLSDGLGELVVAWRPWPADPSRRSTQGILPGVVIGRLLAMEEDGRTPLVSFPGQPGPSALRARTLVDLHGAHIGKELALCFQDGDGTRPVVMGVLADDRPEHLPAQEPFAVESDGRRLILEAREQLVLRCGRASITLTAAGKVLIEGCYVSSQSRGVNRIKGGSIQLN